MVNPIICYIRRSETLQVELLLNIVWVLFEWTSVEDRHSPGDLVIGAGDWTGPDDDVDAVPVDVVAADEGDEMVPADVIVPADIAATDTGGDDLPVWSVLIVTSEPDVDGWLSPPVGRDTLRWAYSSSG